MQYPPIMKGFPVLLHGGDYNPEQWLHMKEEIWPRDMELAKAAGINTLSVGIFSWAVLEPREGEYDFSFLDEIMDMLAANGLKAVLATPSGAKPQWMAEKYPETLRVDADRRRRLYGTRHNHCLSSPVYREKICAINAALAERYKDHPALGMWHVSNEYGGECHCPLCQQRFHTWLEKRYGTIDRLNAAWWNTFWSHLYTSFDAVESPSPIGECDNPALSLNWRRFTSDQFRDFYECESAPLKAITPGVPCTANLMATYEGIDYFNLGRALDVSSWDNYPQWTGDARDADVLMDTAFNHDLMRGVGGQKPFMMMESSPSAVNWQPVNRLRRPGILMLQGMQAVAHGSDSVQYFQFRKGRGGTEKYHGAVVDHAGTKETRVYREVSEVGKRLGELSAITGSAPESRIALIYDWENRWALKTAAFGHRNNHRYEATVRAHYCALRGLAYDVDLIDQTCALEGYRVVVGPMTYMLRPGFAERVQRFVADGGVYVGTYISGWVDEDDKCFLGGWPGPLKDVFGLWDEETDALDETQHNHFSWQGKTYRVDDYAALIHARGAEALAQYDENFYRGFPVLTRHAYGKGLAYYIAARTGGDFLRDFYAALLQEQGLRPLVPDLPAGVDCTSRVGSEGRFLFLLNGNPHAVTVCVPSGVREEDGTPVRGQTELQPWEALVVRTDGE